MRKLKDLNLIKVWILFSKLILFFGFLKWVLLLKAKVNNKNPKLCPNTFTRILDTLQLREYIWPNFEKIKKVFSKCCCENRLF